MRIQQRINALEQKLGGGQGESIENRVEAYMKQRGHCWMGIVRFFIEAKGDKSRFCPGWPEDIRCHLWDLTSRVAERKTGGEAAHA